MTKITFCATRHRYDSYIDFFRLVELSGFPIIYVDELNISKPGVYIVAPHNGEWDPHIKNQDGKQRNAHLIHWNIERPSGSAGTVGKYGERQRSLIYDRIFDEVWVSDRRLADETGLRYVTLGSHPDLGTPSRDKRWTAVDISYRNPRRQTIYKKIKGLAPLGWPPERDEYLKHSKFGIATHQDDHPFMEPLRLALFSAYGLPILSETLFNSYPYGDWIKTAGYNQFTATLNHMATQPYDTYWKMGIQCRNLMTRRFEFGKMVREAIYQRVGDWR